MKNDPWLDKWLNLIKQKSAGSYVLELGCGSGWDTKDLLSIGCEVIAINISMDNLVECEITFWIIDFDMANEMISNILPIIAS